ncbi:hypothetical protein J4475_04125 [Candidatus Woesearchaeota archaeon]|nr:hypothetical protein [Candidatus Woesearchaeota archaeon]
MRIYIEREGRQREISFKGTVRELLHNLNINPETVLVASGNNLLTAVPIRSFLKHVKLKMELL